MTRNEFKKLAKDPVLLDGTIGSNLIAAGMPTITAAGCCGTTPEHIRALNEVMPRRARAAV